MLDPNTLLSGLPPGLRTPLIDAYSEIARNYAETSPGELFAIVGSSGFYEISVAQASAAKKTGCAPGSPVELTIWN